MANIEFRNTRQSQRFVRRFRNAGHGPHSPSRLIRLHRNSLDDSIEFTVFFCRTKRLCISAGMNLDRVRSHVPARFDLQRYPGR